VEVVGQVSRGVQRLRSVARRGGMTPDGQTPVSGAGGQTLHPGSDFGWPCERRSVLHPCAQIIHHVGGRITSTVCFYPEIQGRQGDLRAKRLSQRHERLRGSDTTSAKIRTASSRVAIARSGSAKRSHAGHGACREPPGIGVRLGTLTGLSLPYLDERYPLAWVGSREITRWAGQRKSPRSMCSFLYP
jgi:hypothetical protein